MAGREEYTVGVTKDDDSYLMMMMMMMIRSVNDEIACDSTGGSPHF